MPRPRFTQVPFFVYPVRDMARARRFYGGVLGLKPGAAWGEAWVEYDIGRHATLALSTMLKGCRPGAKGGALALETDRFDAAIAYLKKRRVKIIFGPKAYETCAFARFTDPEGNHLVLHRKH